ncbi:DNA methyltransferase [Roseobacter sp. TSBP12]|uniref:site-specific DNA-methyltransferase n=1 Tax=Roseobacter sp. TSBP12 TaxID=1236613 RepID=UPI00125EFA80|nr:DNA methyltransferase [Roseobacter sp. TSBP12]KAB6717009.1 site-specific DNA-methyltransferase [Roseobacter sp. TSBP12]
MSRLTDLILQAKVKDADLGRELEREFKALASRRSFGLNFERHTPETVELPGRPIRKGDKVRVLPPRGNTDKGDKRLWKVARTNKVDGQRVADLSLIGTDEPEAQTVPVEDLIVVAEFRDYIYPGLVSTGKVTRGGDKPFHTVINGENFHALEALTFTHRGKVDVIYIDPPYNTGAKDWKYNNDYVEGDDLYRHSKWLAFMERRLKVARALMNPTNSTLIVSIDEKEFLRLGLLLEQVFPEGRVQMVSILINPKGQSRNDSFARTDEYLFFVLLGEAKPAPTSLSDEWRASDKQSSTDVYWQQLRRRGLRGAVRREDRPGLFYPIFVNTDGSGLHSAGKPIPLNEEPSMEKPEGTEVLWPTRADGSYGYWQVSHERLMELNNIGLVRAAKPSVGAIYYLKRGEAKKVEDGKFRILGHRKDGSIIAESIEGGNLFLPGTQWRIGSHNAGEYGTNTLTALIPNRRFPFPKSLYAVEDALRFSVSAKPDATILDFFSGSGTTSHAVMRLNKQDGGRRQCISVTNNEVGADEQRALTKDKLRPGDDDWEKWGICDYITKPRIEAAITGQTPDGKPIKGDYKFTDEFPMAKGFEENAEFFTLTYETPVSIGHNRAFARIAPLLWMRAGSEGRRIDALPDAGWDVVDTYGLLTDLDTAAPFTEAVEAAGGIRVAYIVTDDDRRFQSVAQRLPDGVEAVRLYESYLTNFRFAMGR